MSEQLPEIREPDWKKEFDTLNKVLHEDSGPLSMTVSLDRVNGHITFAQSPVMKGRELEDLELLKEALSKVGDLLQSAIVDERVKAKLGELHGNTPQPA